MASCHADDRWQVKRDRWQDKTNMSFVRREMCVSGLVHFFMFYLYYLLLFLVLIAIIKISIINIDIGNNKIKYLNLLLITMIFAIPSLYIYIAFVLSLLQWWRYVETSPSCVWYWDVSHTSDQCCLFQDWLPVGFLESYMVYIHFYFISSKTHYLSFQIKINV